MNAHQIWYIYELTTLIYANEGWSLTRKLHQFLFSESQITVQTVVILSVSFCDISNGLIFFLWMDLFQ